MMILLLLLLASTRPAAAADLSGVVAAALARSPAAVEARARREQAAAASREAFWRRWPRVSAHGALARGDDPLYAFGALLQERRVSAADFNPDSLNRPGFRTTARAGLELGVPLFTGFELTRAQTLANLAVEEAAARGADAAQSVRLRAADAFLRYLKESALLAELDERVASAQAAVASAERLKKQGLVLGSDHQAALAILAGLKAWRARAAAEQAARRVELAVLIGVPVAAADGRLSAWNPPLEDDAALLSAALAARPDLRGADVRLRAAGVRLEGAAQSLLPSAEAFASVNAAAGGLKEGSASRLLGVRTSLTFGDPAYRSRRARAAADEAAAAAARSAAQDAAHGEVLSRAAGLRGLTAALPDMREALARARQALEEVRPLYREGRQSVLEVLRAEEAVARLEDARLEADCRVRADWAALRAAQGTLDDAAVTALARSLEEPR